MYSPANRVFPFSKCGGGGTILIAHTLHNVPFNWLKQTLFTCNYNNYMIEENDKLMFYFLSPNVVLLFVFKIAS